MFTFGYLDVKVWKAFQFSKFIGTFSNNNFNYLIILDLKDQIRKKRKALRLSAEDLATLIGVNKENIYKWEKGTKPSNPEDYIKLMNWLKGTLENIPKNDQEMEPSPMQLLAGLTEGFKAIAETMKSIESKMAQEKTQAKIADQTTKIQFSLQDVQGKVTTLWERQHLAIEEMREHFAKLGVHKIPASEDAHKKRDHNGGNS
jgi:transcriptional regulator with XRE-family HTH domain